jgi:hypothetical protein
MPFKGKPPGHGSGDISHRTQELRPAIGLTASAAARARALRRRGLAPAEIAERFGVSIEAVEKALLQMRSPRPESTRGTLNITLAAHRFVLAERQDEEPLWQTFDRLVDELLRLRASAAVAKRKRSDPSEAERLLPGLLERDALRRNRRRR